jgi:hypothetical protein
MMMIITIMTKTLLPMTTPIIFNLPPMPQSAHHFLALASQTLPPLFKPNPLSKTLPQLLQTRVSETSSALLSQASAAAAAAISAATIRFNGRHDAELKAM